MNSTDSSNFVYFNLDQFNDKDVPALAKFNVNRVNTIIKNPSDYIVAISEFSIPMFSIPLFQFVDNRESVTLEWDGAEVTTFLQYVPAFIGATSQPVFSYQGMIQSFNDAFRTSYIALRVLKPALPADGEPFITLQDNLLTLNAQNLYISTLVNPINIYMNKKAQEFVLSIPIFEVTVDKFQYLIKDTFTNSYMRNAILHYGMTQSTPVISLWNKINKILFVTNHVPVVNEMIGSQDDVQISVFTDFDIESTFNRVLPLTFTPKGPIRIADLVSSYPLSSVDIELRWFSSDGASETILIPPKTRFSVKLTFIKKEYLNLLNIEDYGINDNG